MEIRIDELAHLAGVPSRTIRYYTQQGLLPPPTLRGRVGFYSQGHLDRLRLIRELREKRFLPLSLIGRVLHRVDAGADLETMLTPLDMVYASPWGVSEPLALNRQDLAAEAGVSEDVVDAAEDMGFLFPLRQGRELVYTRDDVHMLEIADEWVRLGLPRELGRAYREAFEEITTAQVRAFGERVAAPIMGRGLPPDEVRHELAEGYRSMAATCGRLVGLLQRKLIQRAVERAAERQSADRHSSDRAERQPADRGVTPPRLEA